METKKPLLSIVVPTKNRYKYLIHLINLVDSFQLNQIELVLQDNSEDNLEILDFLQQKEYPYLKYFHNPTQIPIYLNCDYAIQNSSGEYVCFIGDDDGVTRFILDCVKWMKNNDVEVVVPTTVAYNWPDFVNSVTGNIAGTLSFKPFKFKARMENPFDTLTEIMSHGFINRGNLPLAYHGIVKRSVLDIIYSHGGTYFPGASPDIANGVALSLVTKKYAICDFPLIISGASVSHGGGIRKMKRKAANLSDLPFLPADVEEKWETKIPKIWTGETIWADSAIKGLRYFGRLDLVEKVNYEYLLAWFVCMNPHYLKMAFSLSNNKILLLLRTIFFLSKRFVLAIIRKFTIKFFKYNDGANVYCNINDIQEAEKELVKEISSFKVS